MMPSSFRTLATLLLVALCHQVSALPVTPVAPGAGCARVLVIYANDPFDAIKHLAQALADGATTAGAEVRVLEVSQANYKRDVYGWADGIALGSGVYNGSPAPQLLEFVNSFDFMDKLGSKVGGAFATGTSASAGLEPVLNTIERGLRTFGVITVGGSSWRNAQGTGVVTPDGANMDNHSLSLARGQGSRIAHLAAQLKNSTKGDIPAPLTGVSKVLNSVAVSLGNARWTNQTRLHATCEAYCRGWTAAVGCGTCLPSAFSFPGGDTMCVHPGPLGTGLLCRMNQTTLEPTGQSCCGVGGPCELPKLSAHDFLDQSTQWPGGCCAGGACGNCPGGSPGSDRFPQLNDTQTIETNRRYFDYKAMECRDGVAPPN